MKIKQQIKEFFLKSRKLHINNILFEMELDYNLMIFVVPILFIILVVNVCLLGWWWGTYLYK